MRYNGNQILQKIQALMDERNWSVYKLAKMSDITYSSLNSMFLKNTYPTIPTLEKICAGFQISLSEFFSEDTPYRERIEHTPEEEEILGIYAGLNNKDQKILLSYIRGFARIKP